MFESLSEPKLSLDTVSICNIEGLLRVKVDCLFDSDVGGCANESFR